MQHITKITYDSSYIIYNFPKVDILKYQESVAEVPFEFGKLFMCLEDKLSDSGTATGHYFHQDLFVARCIYNARPKLHVDIGSRVDGFVAHVAVYRPIEVMDIRPLKNHIKNIRFIQANLMRDIPPYLVEYCDSISCLHALEHFGLGRYGDPIQHDGYLNGLDNLRRILKKGGKFYFSVPIGPQRIEFNAHRVFSVKYLVALFDGKYTIDSFSYVDDLGYFHEDVELDNGKRNNFGCSYGCGIFELTKL